MQKRDLDGKSDLAQGSGRAGNGCETLRVRAYRARYSNKITNLLRNSESESISRNCVGKRYLLATVVPPPVNLSLHHSYCFLLYSCNHSSSSTVYLLLPDSSSKQLITATAAAPLPAACAPHPQRAERRSAAPCRATWGQHCTSRADTLRCPPRRARPRGGEQSPHSCTLNSKTNIQQYTQTCTFHSELYTCL